MGFARANGKVGVRNEVWIIPTVGCVNNIATAMAKAANARVKGSVEGSHRIPASVWMFPDGRRPGAHQNDSGGSGKIIRMRAAFSCSDWDVENSNIGELKNTSAITMRIA